jgi:hypothetical protein
MFYEAVCYICDDTFRENDRIYVQETHLCPKCKFIIDKDVNTVANKTEIEVVKQLIKMEDLIT